MPEITARFGLPLLVAGQGQKDITHNEALVAVDVLVHPSVRSRQNSAPPEFPENGACWLVPAGAVGNWSGKTDAIACWTAGGWRFLALPEGGSVWIEDEAVSVRFRGGSWILDAPRNYPAVAVPDPVGGTIIDAEARAAMASILDRMRHLGLLSS